MKFLEGHPILKGLFDRLRNSLEDISNNLSENKFEAQCDKYLDFLEFLSEIVTSYEEILGFLEEEPILKVEFYRLRHSLESPLDNCSEQNFERHYEDYQKLLSFLHEIVALPKNKKFFV